MHCLKASSTYVAIDNQVCFHRWLFANPVKLPWCITGPVEPLGSTYQNWWVPNYCHAMSILIYPVDCVHLCHLLRTQHYCPCPNGKENPCSTCPPTPTTPCPLPPTYVLPFALYPWYYQGCKKLSQKPAVNTAWHSWLWNTSYKTALLIKQIWHGYNVAQEDHSCFNISKWYFSKYKMHK